MSPLRYDDDSLFGAARNSDPATAKDAAKSMTAPILNRQRREVLDAVREWSSLMGGGATAWNVSNWSGNPPLQQNVVARRLTDLKRLEGGGDLSILRLILMSRLDPIECDCDSPAPDGIGECSCCRRRVMPDRR